MNKREFGCLTRYASFNLLLLRICGYGAFFRNNRNVTKDENRISNFLYFVWKTFTTMLVVTIVSGYSLYLYYYIFIGPARAVNVADTQNIVGAICSVTGLTCVLIANLYILFKYNDIIPVVMEIDHYCTLHLTKRTKRTVLLLHISFCIFLFFVNLYRTTTNLRPIIWYDEKNFSDSIVWKVTNVLKSFFGSRLSFFQYRLIGIFVMVFEIIFAVGYCSFVSVMFSLCVEIGFCFRDMGNVARTAKIPKAVMSLIQQHSDLSNLVEQLNTKVTFYSFLWYSNYLVALLWRVPSYKDWQASTVQIVAFSLVSLVVHTSCHLFANQQADRVVSTLHEFLDQIEDPQVQSKLFYYVNRRQTRPVGFTVGDFFLVDRSFVIMFIGSMVTYTLFMWEAGEKGLSAGDITLLKKALREEHGNFSRQ